MQTAFSLKHDQLRTIQKKLHQSISEEQPFSFQVQLQSFGQSFALNKNLFAKASNGKPWNHDKSNHHHEMQKYVN